MLFNSKACNMNANWCNMCKISKWHNAPEILTNNYDDGPSLITEKLQYIEPLADLTSSEYENNVQRKTSNKTTINQVENFILPTAQESII